MLIEIIMPKIGFSIEEGKVEKWLKQEGDKVNAGEPLFEISSDKANVEVEAHSAGFLRKILVGEGDIVPVLNVIGYIGDMDESIPEDDVISQNKPIDAHPVKQVEIEPVQNVNMHVDKPKLSPRARKFAGDNDISTDRISMIPGTGVNGLIVERDLKALLVTKSAHTEAGEMITSSKYKQITAERLTRSIQEIPQFVTGVDVDATALLKFKERFNERKEKVRVSITCLLIKCVAKAISDNMNVNVSWNNGRISVLRDINIGIAIAAGNGLVVPVINGPDKKGVLEIAAELNRLTEKAKDGKLTPDDISGGTFTISNLGMFEVDSFQAIVNPPESGILAVGRINRKPAVAADGEIVSKPMMWLNLTSDHRVLDGVDAAKLLGKIKLYVEFPEMLIG